MTNKTSSIGINMADPVMDWNEFCEGHYNSYPMEDNGEIIQPDKKLEYRRKIIQYWVKARVEAWEQRGMNNADKRKRRPGALVAMKELHEEFPEASMMIINFTNRNRRDLPEDLDRDYADYPDWKLQGLRKVIQEWGKQENDPRTRDSLEDLILSKKELYSTPEYRVGSIVHRVRRLRKGLKSNPENLELADRMLDVAEKLLTKHDPVAGNHTILPSKHIRLLIQMQFHLNDTRRGLPRRGQEALNQFTKELEELHANPEHQNHPGISVYYWWALRISNTHARAKLDFDEADEYRAKMDNVKKSMTAEVRSYIDCIEVGESKGELREKRIADYHEALAEFMNQPSKSLTGTKGTLRDREGLLYRSALGDDGAAGHVNLFVWTETLSVIKLIGKNEEDVWESTLIRRCRESILNSKFCCSRIAYRNSSSTYAMLMLVSVDLMIRMRWFLSGSRIYNDRAEWGKKIGTKTREKLENKLAEEFKEEIIQTLEEVLRQTSDARELHNLIQNWVEGLEELDFKDKEQYPSGGGVKWKGPLGQLCDFCGELVGWKWAPIKNDKSTGRKRTGLKDYELRLYGSDGAGPMLRITTDGDTNNPYLRQVGESSFRQ